MLMRTDRVTLHLGDCREVMAGMPDNSVDSVVCDPPYELGFMGKSWDASGIAYDAAMWAEALRVLKPGGHLLAFSGSRTYHRMTCAIEDAGFEVRDQIMWVYGSGFPKSLDVSKAIDKAAGATREVVGLSRFASRRPNGTGGVHSVGIAGDGGSTTAPATPDAHQWQGFGTALKPAHEPICVARKPLSEKTVAANVLKWGTGALNVDGCRVAAGAGDYAHPGNSGIEDKRAVYGKFANGNQSEPHTAGRWPANLIHDGSEEVVAGFPDGAPAKAARTGKRGGSSWHGNVGFGTPEAIGNWPADQGGSAARFFYCAKASKRDREAGLEDMALHQPTHGKGHEKGGLQVSNSINPKANIHPTVKPTDLMRYLCRLVTPPGGTVLDPFTGSGSTGRGAVLEGFQFIGIEMTPEYHAIAGKRIADALADTDLLTGIAA